MHSQQCRAHFYCTGVRTEMGRGGIYRLLKRREEGGKEAEKGKAVLYASALDPRHKHMRFIAQTLRSKIKENLSEMCKTVQLPDRGTSTDDAAHQPQASASPATGSQNQAAATSGTCTKA
ncbi:unnamed protein product [Arctogadus glacialis]